MNSKVYRWCAVPQCANTSIKKPNKLFVFVPQKKIIRDKWLKLARRDTTGILPSTHLYFCEDHFDSNDRREPSSPNANTSRNKKEKVKAVVSKIKQVTAANNSLKPTRSNAKTSKSEQENISTTAANETEWSSSNLKLTKVLCVNCNEEVQPSQVATMLEGQVKSVIAKVYHFLEREVEYLMTKCAALDLTPLLDIRQRTAEATGFSESTVSEVLGEEKWYEEQTEPPEKRLRLDLDHETDRVENLVETLVVKEEADDEHMQQAEATPRPVVVKVEPSDDNVNKADTRAGAVTSNVHIKAERDDGVFHVPLSRGGMFANNDSTQLNNEDGETCLSDMIKIEPLDEFHESGTPEDIASLHAKIEITEEGFS